MTDTPTLEEVAREIENAVARVTDTVKRREIITTALTEAYERGQRDAMHWQPIEYEESAGRIELPRVAPFNGDPVLILLAQGAVEAWWMDWEPSPTLEDPNDGDGWCWVCLDDSAPFAMLDDASHWMPLPTPPNSEKEGGE